MNHPSMTVARRLGLNFGALALLLIVVSAIAVWAMRLSTANLQTMYADRLEPVHAIGEIQYLTTRNRMILLDAVVNPAADHVAKRVAEVKDNNVRMDKTWADYMATRMDGEEKALADASDAARKAYTAQGMLPMLAAIEAGKADDARAIENGAVAKLAPALNAAIAKLMKYEVDVARREKDAAVDAARLAEAIMAAASVLAVALAVGLAWLVTRRITRALGAEPDELSQAVQRVADGDLGSPVTLRPGDTSSTMASVARMRDALAGVVGSVRANADSVATGSTQIAQGNADLSQRTEEQASALQQTAATMDELSSTVRNNADNAKQANQLAMNASTVAVQGGEVVAQVVGTMKGINDSSRRIADIIGVIDGIAFQTNILALNAAVEAARAGEQGRGFAVVAGEVRTLAHRSADAAKEIKGLITTSVERVEEGTGLVDQAGRTMEEIVAAIKRVTDIVGEITAASDEQSRGVQQVGEAVTQMDQVTQQNAALVEQSAAAAESLKQQAQALVAAVGTFKLGGGGAMAALPRDTARSTAASRAPSRGAAPAAAAKPAPAAPRAPSSPAAAAAPPKPAAPAAPKAASSPPKAADGGGDDWETF